ncbi:uncharacterized protein MONOS_9960 [Monocercomonoides exilis]|uniref:uncharacterized protein n=1 Tax=Monocercomonoides exilis TaxID=2049356 RepID=UPI003559E8AF|nr:hypothetical protein MONOS_9960 [Monocercomonoides exilis]|eukprot:MONOS_9960.1-p1 / transcript=MONOS_9960.1 / gene=MONOS_9960 / organism=Monocercomonoides_exilis_PA203 / gene_product=unspecified product / transcript_product=unspecified product / location=Mono_scaffold00431:47980-48375(-) / protein_length=132 / sequence_SO=supercontig / SO=protein_coding / is_pseudo=false
MAGERELPFFIPKLEGASASENGGGTEIQFNGALLLPCDLSFRLFLSAGDTDLIETYHFKEDGFVSETEVIGRVPSENISLALDETEVFVMILFGKRLSATDAFVLKKRSEPKTNGDERIVEGGKEGKSYW